MFTSTRLGKMPCWMFLVYLNNASQDGLSSGAKYQFFFLVLFNREFLFGQLVIAIYVEVIP